MNQTEIKDIIALYKKHGWTLRRVLLLNQSRERLAPDSESVFGKAEIRDADLDALWFSRRSRPDCEAWELRRLAGTPFALVETIPDGTADDERELMLRGVELHMLRTLKKGNGRT